MTWRPPTRDPYVDLADEAAHAAAVRTRAEERRRRERATEVATWIGTLRDLAERQVPCVVGAAGGRMHRGRIIAVAVDHLAVRAEGGTTVLVVLDLVRLVRPEPGRRAPPAMGDREAAGSRTLVDVLDRLVEVQATVAVVLRDVEDPYEGDVLGLGEDVLTLRLRGGDRATVLLPLAGIAEVLVTDHR